MTNFSDTICAPATSVGTGAVSIIRISGPESLKAVDSIVGFRSGNACGSRGYVLKYGEIPGVDEVVAGIYRAPHSYTGEDAVELCCHASPYVVRRILELLSDAGCRLAEPGEFTRRAFVNGKMDLAQAEAVADMIAADSEAQHRVALNQLRGGYSAELGKIRAELLRLTTLMELELDFSEEDVEFADRASLAEMLDDAIVRCTALADSFRAGNAIRNGVPVAIVGAPNSGKSTLLNALLHDERAIVSDVPGTTRDTVEETCMIGGALFRFIDTAGIRETSDKVERLGIERSFNKAAEAEVVLGVVDVSVQDIAEDSADIRLKGRSDLESVKDTADELSRTSQPDAGAKAGTEPSGPEADRHHPGGPVSLEYPLTDGSPVQGLSIPANSRQASRGPVSRDTDEDSSVFAQIRKLVGMVDPKRQKLVILMNKCDKLPENTVGAPGSDQGDSQSSSSGDLYAELNANKKVTSINNFVKTLVSESDAVTVLWVSAKSDFGLDRLRELLASSVTEAAANGVLVTNARHAAALRDAAASLREVREGLDARPTDLLAEDLRTALASLGTITGEITTEEVLGEVFKGFCIGK